LDVLQTVLQHIAVKYTNPFSVLQKNACKTDVEFTFIPSIYGIGVKNNLSFSQFMRWKAAFYFLHLPSKERQEYVLLPVRYPASSCIKKGG
jgi:hypothetical protein